MFALIGIALCLMLAYQLVMAALAGWYAAQAIEFNDFSSANLAIHYARSDPNTHLALATLLLREGQNADAVLEFEKAITLSPNSYQLWMDLSAAKQKCGDRDGAIVAIRKAVSLAPHYAEPRWELGLLLLDKGNNEDAFVEIRKAIDSNPEFINRALDVAWKTFDSNTEQITQAIKPVNSSEYTLVARFFIKHEKFAEALSLFRSAGEVANEDSKNLLIDFLDAKRFVEAYEVWRIKHASNRQSEIIDNHDFENLIHLNEFAFSWQPARNVHGLSFTIDSNEKQSGFHSLLIELNNVAGEIPALISQLVIVEPNSKYHLSFFAKTKDIQAKGELPIFTVTDAVNDSHDLAHSKPLTKETNDWQNYVVEFTTSHTTNAVLIALRTTACNDSVCSIRGSIWLDNFSLKKL